jgi:bacillithiol system protein YtxJ
MYSNISYIESIEALDAVFAESAANPVVIFKHSNRCGISSHVLEQVVTIGANVNVVVVQSSRELSNVIETRTGYRHQSPQAFVIKDGRAVYQASHYGIDASAISRFLEK